jgi:hypothetical protein
MAAAGITDRITGKPEVNFPIADHLDIDRQPARNDGCRSSGLDPEQLLSIGAGNLLPVRVADSNLVEPVFGFDHILVRIIN